MSQTTRAPSESVLAGLGAAQLVATVAASRLIGRDDTYPLYLLSYFAMGAVWLVATRYVCGAGRGSRRCLWVAIGFGLAMRLVLAPSEPTLSDDIYRYVWDGRVQHAGINPYLHAPEAEALAHLRDAPERAPAIYPGINNKDIPTIYPPLMQMVFFAATAVSESAIWMKWVFVSFDLALVLLLARLLEALGLSALRTVVYAWSPLVLVEVAGSGHNDVLGALCLVAALLMSVKRRDALAMIALALSGMAKLVGFLVAPVFARSVRPKALAAIPLVALASSLPYAGAGASAFEGLTQYGLRWRGNDGLFHLLFAATGSLDTAKTIVALLLVSLVSALVVLRACPVRATYLTLTAILLLTATVHPWYLLWIAPLLAIYPSAAWLYLSLAIGLGYHAAYLSTPGAPWEDVSWVKWLEYGPFFALASASVALRLARGRRAMRELLGLHSAP